MIKTEDEAEDLFETVETELALKRLQLMFFLSPETPWSELEWNLQIKKNSKSEWRYKKEENRNMNVEGECMNYLGFVWRRIIADATVSSSEFGKEDIVS